MGQSGVRDEVEHLLSTCRTLLERCDEPVGAVELWRPRCGDVLEQGVAGGGAEPHEQAGLEGQRQWNWEISPRLQIE